MKAAADVLRVDNKQGRKELAMTIETTEQWNESIRRGREIIAREVAKALDADAWAAYSKAWPEAMAGQPRAQRMRDAGYTPRPRMTGSGGLPLGDE